MIKTTPHINPSLLKILKSVPDPEIPVLTIVDLGVVRDAEVLDDGTVLIQITPTYSGCPAMDVIGDDIVIAFAKAGMKAKVKLVLSPAWSTDMISEEGREALEKYGIAAPLDATEDKEALLGNRKLVKCPQCGSTNTNLVSQFGSTACKAQFKCNDCMEPFDYFKCLK